MSSDWSFFSEANKEAMSNCLLTRMEVGVIFINEGKEVGRGRGEGALGGELLLNMGSVGQWGKGWGFKWGRVN